MENTEGSTNVSKALIDPSVFLGNFTISCINERASQANSLR